MKKHRQWMVPLDKAHSIFGLNIWVASPILTLKSEMMDKIIRLSTRYGSMTEWHKWVKHHMTVHEKKCSFVSGIVYFNRCRQIFTYPSSLVDKIICLHLILGSACAIFHVNTSFEASSLFAICELLHKWYWTDQFAAASGRIKTNM